MQSCLAGSMLVSEKSVVHIRIRVVCKALWDTSVTVPAEVAVSIQDHPTFTPRRVIVTWSYTAQNYYKNTVLHLLFLTQSVSPFEKFVCSNKNNLAVHFSVALAENSSQVGT